MSEQDFAGAVSAFGEAIRLEPEDAEVYQQRSLAHLSLGRFAEALSDGNSAVRFAPDDVESYRVRGQASLALGDHAGAVTDFDWVIRREKRESEPRGQRWHAYFLRGCAHASGEDLKRALSDLNKAATFSPIEVGIYFERSKVHARLGNTKKAERDRLRGRRLNLEFTGADMDLSPPDVQ